MESFGKRYLIRFGIQSRGLLGTALILILTSFSVSAYDDLDKDPELAKRTEAKTFYRNVHKMDANDLLNSYRKYRDDLETAERFEILDILDAAFRKGDSGIRSYLVYERGAALFHAGRFGEAVVRFRQVTGVNPDLEIRKYYSMARAFRALENPDSAAAYYSKVYTEYPESVYADDARFWIAHMEEDYLKSISLFTEMLENTESGDHRAGALERVVGLDILAGRIEEAKIIINKYRGELNRDFSEELCMYYLLNNDLSSARALLEKDGNTWPGRFRYAQCYIEKLIYSGADRKSVINAYKECISPAYKDVRNFSAYFDSGDFYKGMEAFSFLKPRKRIVYADTLRSISEFYELPELFGDSPELIYSYMHAAELPGTQGQREDLINRSAALMQKEKLWHAYLNFARRHTITDDMQKLRENELYNTYLIKMDRTRALNVLQEQALTVSEDYLAAQLMSLVSVNIPDISRIKAHYEFIINHFPNSPYRKEAGHRLMRLYYFLDRNYTEVTALYKRVHPTRDLPPDPDMGRIYLLSQIRLNRFDLACGRLCFHAMVEDDAAEKDFSFLYQNALSLDRPATADSLLQFMHTDY